jgi:anti-anti-sigma factor
MKVDREDDRFRRIFVEKIDGVTVVSFKDSFLLDEQISVESRNDILRLLEEDRPGKLVVDFNNVTLMGSGTLSTLVLTDKKISGARGKLILCNISPVVMSAFRVSNMDRLFPIMSDLAAALKAMSGSMFIACPVAGCDGKSRVPELRQDDQLTLTCMRCQTRLGIVRTVPRPKGKGEVELSLSSLEFPTFEGESVTITLTPHARISLAGRLDVFSSGVLERAWKTLSAPRQAVFDLTKATSLSQRGVEALTGLCSQTSSPDRAVILIDKGRKDQSAIVPAGPPVYTSESRAISALKSGLGPHAAKITAKVIHN